MLPVCKCNQTKYLCGIKIYKNKDKFKYIDLVHFKLSSVGEDTNRGCAQWSVSPPTTISSVIWKFEMHLINR